MPLFVKLPSGTVAGFNGASVADLKVWAAEQCGASPLELAVYAPAGQALSDDAQLSDFQSGDATTLEVQPLVLGGKVHGSLARAGKVRGQTPKVAKAEKKKSKTGRAKRRGQYNKRFVATVNLPGGRKRGPNAQPTT